MSTCSDESCDKECPLCMETLELDDINFYPCKCEYQICRFCWHRIRTDENGLCPACRQPYPEDPVNFKPMTTDDVRKHKDEQRLKKQAEKLKLSDARQYLCNYRVLQKNLVYVVGLSPRVADPEILKKNEYFGRYGKIQKIVTSATPSLPAPHLPPSHTAYVTYKRVDDALRAIQGVHNSMLDGRLVKASLGTTKYCSSFLNSRKCFKPVGECMYLHENAEAEISFTKDDMHLGKHTEYEKRLIESMNSRPPPPQSTLASQLDKILAPTSNSPRRYLEDDSDTVDDVERTGSAIHMCADDPDDDDADSTNTSNSIDDPAPSNPADETVNSRRSNQTARERQWSERDEISVAPSNTPPTDPEGNENEFEEDIHRNDVSDLMSKLDVNDDRLARTSFSENDYLGIPAPAKHQEAPAPLMQWEALLGLSSPSAQSTIVEPSSLFPTFKMDSGFNSQSLFGTHTSSTPSFRREASPPPGLARFNSDDDLGFDPFTESSKGLSALLQEEQEQIPPHNSASNHTLDVLKHSRLFGQLPEQRQSTQQHPQHLQSSHQQHPLQQNQDQHHSFLHQLHAQQQHQQQQFAADMNRQQDYMYSRLMSQQQQQSQQQRQFDSTPGFSHPFGSMQQQQQSSQQQQHQSQSSQSSSLLQDLFNRQQQQHQAQQQAQQHQQQQMYAGINSYMYNDMLMPRVPFGMAPPPGLGGPSTNRSSTTQQAPPHMTQQSQQQQQQQQSSMGLFGMGGHQSMMQDHQSQQPQSAQDAFKALLPNVNVRFMDDNSMSRWSHENSLRSSAVPPPPGFSSVMNR
ncbi:CCR4-NOT transcription complex subunit 4 [Caenorhabditis elegans]|uniref:CCR4-NOT transcription complex subunit 4 n=1 Tax=Caenorhabditis elegans TaxID=6239 RepID=W6RTE4_CAEEL|nr:CCR4-NOT transcription complex subunit 4 [Caenorhabditis elegans]CDM63497.1 CCR4-NOT transcription complex subunit 4 [Caenorhabditis elegans]|eukprot:NP_001294151.1 NOT-Like (yeast CCR4/NOT complex component) [Caenorhabditis elegans]